MLTPQLVTIDWDALKSDFRAERKSDDSLLFGNTAEQKDRFRAVDRYAKRLPDRTVHKLRMLAEVGVHCQFPSRAFIVGLDPGVTKRERLPTAEEVAGYNLIRSYAAVGGAVWETDFLAKLHHKLTRATGDRIRWTANDLINLCERQIPELLSQLNSAEALGETSATIFVGPANGASILMALLGQIIEAVICVERDLFDEIDLQPASRVQ